jgi:hypothetical protein
MRLWIQSRHSNKQEKQSFAISGRIRLLCIYTSKVFVHFSAGSFENWRPDNDSFPDVVKGKPLDGWFVCLFSYFSF